MPDSIYANSGIPPSEVLKSFKERAYLRRPQIRRPRRGPVATALGIVTLLCAVLGLAYNASTLADVLSGSKDAIARERPLMHFHAAFYGMSAICITCYLLLILGAIWLMRGRPHATRLLAGVWFFEIAYFFLVGTLWGVPVLGASIAGATGLADGGMMFQFILLLPLWGPLAIFWMRCRQGSTSGRVVAR